MCNSVWYVGACSSVSDSGGKTGLEGVVGEVASPQDQEPHLEVGSLQM